jgi:hypothetical protein
MVFATLNSLLPPQALRGPDQRRRLISMIELQEAMRSQLRHCPPSSQRAALILGSLVTNQLPQ